MSFVSDKVKEYNEKQRIYTIEIVEQAIADIIADGAKSTIEQAIESGESSVKCKYDHDEGFTSLYLMYETEDEYLNGSAGVPSLAYLINPSYEKNRDKLRLRSAITQSEKTLNFTSIENRVAATLRNLGVKEVRVHIEFREYYNSKVLHKGLFRDTYTVERAPLNLYKICYTAAW